MLDKQTEMMLSVANLLSAEELEQIKEAAPSAQLTLGDDRTIAEVSPAPAEEPMEVDAEDNAAPRPVPASDGVRGERERQRTRESKIATGCVGQERRRHDWWSLGTRLVGRVDGEAFTGIVVENPQVKSGRSLQITSGPAAGCICITPTRAALEATEAYRQTHNLGRGGGVTNGWTFWQPEA